MKIEYLGHSCFHFQDTSGLSVLIDPYDAQVGYRIVPRRADYTLITHAHADHANLSSVLGPTRLVIGCGEHRYDRLEVRAVLAYHDAQKGKLRGAINIMCFTLDSIRVCHLSDLGHTLNSEQLAAIGSVDVLLVPVGGEPFTIDATIAKEVVAQIHPRVAIPMHYRTASTNRDNFPISDVEPFLVDYPRVIRHRQGWLDILPTALPADFTVYVVTHT